MLVDQTVEGTFVATVERGEAGIVVIVAIFVWTVVSTLEVVVSGPHAVLLHISAELANFAMTYQVNVTCPVCVTMKVCDERVMVVCDGT